MKNLLPAAVGALFALGAIDGRAATFADVNAALGFPLLADDSLWDDDATATAARLRWPAESDTPEQSSHRLYTAAEAKSLGAHPFSEVLQSAAEKPARVSLIFANMGDFGDFFKIAQALETAKGSEKSGLERQGKELLKDFPKALAADGQAIAASLTAVFGSPHPSSQTMSSSNAEKVSQWDWQGHSFLLSQLENGFVALQIVPTASLEANESAARQRDAALKEKLRAQLQKRPNGDVVVGALPMVDQGPKGFCVPATLERYARYMGMPADMYVIAIQAETGMGGGTTSDSIFAVADRMARANGRRLDRMPGNLRLNTIARYIDDGLPIMWGLDAREDLEKDITDRAAQRKTVTDPLQWKAVLKNVPKPKKLKDTPIAAHMCLITGYNKTTDEVAISDSWGPEFAERWMTLDELDAMKLGNAAVITF